MKIHRKGLVIAAAVLFFCGLCAVRFTFAGKYIMIPYWTKSTSPKGMHYGVPLGIPYWTKSTSPKGMHNSVKAVAETMSLLDGKLKEIVKEAAEKKLEIGIVENREGEFVFTFSIDDFIGRYNSIYQADRGNTYLAPSWEWRAYNYDRAIHSDYGCSYYNYSKDESILPFPTISVYTPAGSDNVHEITLNFDDHSYTEPLFKAYEDMCFYTLKTLLYDMEDEEIVTLYATLNDLAYEHLTSVNYTSESVPYAVYCRGNVALYPYFSIGESLRLCIIPAAQQYIEEMESRGAKIIIPKGTP
ncbi:hypothetical protein GN277_06960 [Lachnospiraceae bacterium WCA-9-b2]|uniref:Uncharacterized protein n=2 Tax=Sporofaciens musculi TaxID=2681861 RepID=A0A7X3SI79_9FIRM|nr:hypothetical protein [Sporofaciens musculi]MXP75129.1 hypothetical protein [Sporofaciens musculi]